MIFVGKFYEIFENCRSSRKIYTNFIEIYHWMIAQKFAFEFEVKFKFFPCDFDN